LSVLLENISSLKGNDFPFFQSLVVHCVKKVDSMLAFLFDVFARFQEFLPRDQFELFC